MEIDDYLIKKGEVYRLYMCSKSASGATLVSESFLRKLETKFTERYRDNSWYCPGINFMVKGCLVEFRDSRRLGRRETSMTSDLKQSLIDLVGEFNILEALEEAHPH